MFQTVSTPQGSLSGSKRVVLPKKLLEDFLHNYNLSIATVSERRITGNDYPSIQRSVNGTKPFVFSGRQRCSSNLLEE